MHDRIANPIDRAKAVAGHSEEKGYAAIHLRWCTCRATDGKAKWGGCGVDLHPCSRTDVPLTSRTVGDDTGKASWSCVRAIGLYYACSQRARSRATSSAQHAWQMQMQQADK